MQASPGLAQLCGSALLSAGLVLAGCAPAPPRAEVDDRDAATAQQAYDAGQYRKAALQWQQEAMRASEAQASHFRLLAAESWWRAEEPANAEDILRWVDRRRLSAPDQSLMDLLLAELALVHRRPDEARALLEQAADDLSPRFEPQFRALAARVGQAMKSPGAASMRRAAEAAQSMHRYDAEAALVLLKTLEGVPSDQLALRARSAIGDPLESAWFDLALVLRNHLVDGEPLDAAVRAWKTRHPEHPATAGSALDLWLRYRQQFKAPRHVAILLPESGGLKAAGSAIRDGIMSAYLERPGGSQISFYGTGDDDASVLAAYFEAVDDGADWIIGPLNRSSVEALLNLAGLSTPILALNQLPGTESLPEGLAPQVFGLSLSQEREAAAVARQMSERGYRRVIVLAPESLWGDRIAGAFQAEFLQESGKILAAARYLPEENDHSAVLERILQIDESRARKTRLQDRLQIPLEFEPVTRDDVDAIFLAAEPDQGRLLRPQLRYFDAGDIPTFSTSRVYTGKPDAASNRDLDGLLVPLTNWQLEHARADQLPRLESLREGELAALFAIGMDAWNLLPWLDLMRRDPDFRFPGATGSLSVLADGNIGREPAWGYFDGGIAHRAAAGPAPAGRLAAQP